MTARLGLPEPGHSRRSSPECGHGASGGRAARRREVDCRRFHDASFLERLMHLPVSAKPNQFVRPRDRFAKAGLWAAEGLPRGSERGNRKLSVASRRARLRPPGPSSCNQPPPRVCVDTIDLHLRNAPTGAQQPDVALEGAAAISDPEALARPSLRNHRSAQNHAPTKAGRRRCVEDRRLETKTAGPYHGHGELAGARPLLKSWSRQPDPTLYQILSPMFASCKSCLWRMP